MDKYEDVVDMAAESLEGLFGEDAPENAALDIAAGFGFASVAENVSVEAFAEDIWERYCTRVGI